MLPGCLLILLSVAGCGRQRAAAPEEVYAQGQRLLRQDDAPRALAVAGQGLSQAEKRGDALWVWKFRLLKAEVLLGQGNAAPAVKLLTGDMPAAPAFDELRGRQLLDLGWAASNVSDWEGSLPYFQQAARIARRQGFIPLLAETLLRQGDSLVRLGNLDGAQQDFRSALALARQQHDVYLEASALGTLGFVRMNDARYDEAIDFFDQALPLFRKIPSPRLTARTLDNLGYCEYQLGDEEKAIPLFEEASQLTARAHLWLDLQISLGRMGDATAGSGDPARALGYYKRALEAARRAGNRYWMANWLYDLATTSIRQGQLDQAKRYNDQALALQQQMNNPMERLWPVLNTARLAELKNQPAAAEDAYHAVIAGAEGAGSLRDPSIVIQARSGFARLLVNSGHARQAEAQWQKTLALINASRAGLQRDEHRLTYLSSMIRFYQDYVDFLAAQGRMEQALLVAESSRARLLAEKLQSARPVALAVTLPQLRALARRSHAVLLAYWLAPRRSFLWVVTPTGLTTFTLPAADKVTQLTDAYARAITALEDPLATANPAGAELYRLLLEPARALIPPGSRVAIEPDAALYNLNFASLPVPQPSPHYWLEDVTLSVVPSLATLAQRAHPARRLPDSLLLIGNPDSPDPKLYPQLASASREIEQIQGRFPRAREVVYTGAAATPDAYAASQPSSFRFIHFTAHAVANRAEPLDSAVILSRHNDQYKLYARDVMDLPVRADLVTISACRSAGARSYAGEGLVGLAWAFLRAGSRHVIAGLWEVDDNSTAGLMAGLYAGLLSGQGPAGALRAAQLSLLHSDGAFHKPYYWAPFEVFADALGSGPAPPQHRTFRAGKAPARTKSR